MRKALSIAFAAAGAALITRRLLPRRGLSGRVMLITGGSRGLGLVLARQFLRKGARVALLARSGVNHAHLDLRMPMLEATLLIMDPENWTTD